MENKRNRNNENSANYRSAISDRTRESFNNRDRNKNSFNPRNRDYDNYEEYAEESAINPLDKPINGNVNPKESRMNKANRKVNDSLDD